MRIGTLRCWLFGHNYKFMNLEYSLTKHRWEYIRINSDNCVRCGIKQEES